MLTSAATASARPPSSRIAAAVCCASSSERSATITAAPSRAHIIAVARPLPIESLSPAFAGPSAPPPTINATLPVSRAMIYLLRVDGLRVHRHLISSSGSWQKHPGRIHPVHFQPAPLLRADSLLFLRGQEGAGF